jgi:hypothetical protein
VKAIFYLVFVGYNSFHIANARHVPMGQFHSVFKSDIKLDRAYDRFPGEHLLKENGSTEYREEMKAAALEMIACLGSSDCIYQCAQSLCKKCKTDKRLQTPPAIYIPMKVMTEWQNIFHVHQSRVALCGNDMMTPRSNNVKF